MLSFNMSTQRHLAACCGGFSTWFPRIAVNLLTLWAEWSMFLIVPRMNSVIGRVCLFWATIWYVLLTYSYYKIVAMGGGSPRQYLELLQDEESGEIPACIRESVLAKRNGRPRYCQKCLCWKPDRTHHCARCRQCVLKMDHHCPWFSTCIGFKNHKYFVQLLWYVVLFSATISLATIWDLTHWFSNESYEHEYVDINEILLTLVSSVFCLVLLVFTAYTTYLMATNSTTLEAMEGSALRTSLPTSQFRYRPPPTLESIGNVFDLGWRQNCTQVLGSTWAQWILPIEPVLPDGLDGVRFPVKPQLLELAESRAQTEIALHARKPLHAASDR